jgi:hypothetical protein
MNETLHGGAILGAFQQDMGSVNICLSESERVTEGVIHMSLGSEVDNGINFIFFEDEVDKVVTADISFDELEVREITDFFEVFEAGAVIELVINYNVVLGVFGCKKDCCMGTDETYLYRISEKCLHIIGICLNIRVVMNE